MKLKRGFLFVLLAMPVWAHDIWFLSNDHTIELLYGHASPEAYNPAKVTNVRAYDFAGHSITPARVAGAPNYTIQSNSKIAALLATFDNGYWVETSSGVWGTVPRDVALKAAVSHHPLKYHKSLFGWSASFGKPLGQKLEIVPLKNPFSLTPGLPLPVGILFNGKALPKAVVEYGAHGDRALRVTSDEQGFAVVPISEKGEQFVAVDYEPDHGAGERVSYSTSLRFER